MADPPHVPHVLRYADVPAKHRASLAFLRETLRPGNGRGGALPAGLHEAQYLARAAGAAPETEPYCQAAERYDVARRSVDVPRDPDPDWTTPTHTRLYSRCPRPVVAGATLCRLHGGAEERRTQHHQPHSREQHKEHTAMPENESPKVVQPQGSAADAVREAAADVSQAKPDAAGTQRQDAHQASGSGQGAHAAKPAGTAADAIPSPSEAAHKE